MGEDNKNWWGQKIVFHIRKNAFTGSSYVCVMSVRVLSLDPEDLTYASTMEA